MNPTGEAVIALNGERVEPGGCKARWAAFPFLWGRLGRRVLVFALAFGALLTVGITAVQVGYEYSDQVDDLNRQLDMIQHSDVPGISLALWTFNRELVMAQSEGLLRIPGITRVVVESNFNDNHAVVYAGGTAAKGEALFRSFPLYHAVVGGENRLIGTLHVESALEDVYRSLFERFSVVLAGQAVKTFLTSFFMLYLFHALVARHLDRIANHVRRFSDEGRPLQLDRCEPSDGDELSSVVDAMNSRAELVRQTRTDHLTGLANRRWFDASLQTEWSRAMRNRASLGLLLIDVDAFCAYNDHYGAQAGDRCLIELADAVREVVRRPADIVARFGGERLACLLPDTDLAGARIIAREISARFRARNIAHAASQTADIVTVSIGGTAIVPEDDQVASDLVHAADCLLFSAKQAGRDRYVLSPF